MQAKTIRDASNELTDVKMSETHDRNAALAIDIIYVCMSSMFVVRRGRVGPSKNELSCCRDESKFLRRPSYLLLVHVERYYLASRYM